MIKLLHKHIWLRNYFFVQSTVEERLITIKSWAKFVNFSYEIIKALRQKGLAYLIVGIYNTLFGIGLYALMIKILGEKHYLLLSILCNIIAITNSYLTQKFFVFKTRGNYLTEYFKFLSVYISSSVIFMLPLYVMVDLLHISPIIANFFIIIVATFVTFVANNFFAFRKKDGN